MAKLTSNQLAYSLYLLSIFSLLISTEMAMVEGKLCERRSKTWSGFCGNSGNCDRQCKNWEGARSGACHAQSLGLACFCYFNCRSRGLSGYRLLQLLIKQITVTNFELNNLY
ncbi:defensin-like protein 19 [Eucalyptus grandis]|uniref:defensin-like protein 19 n=1 Tax=Eucalyptus grandis TaxID=71139 RepID=UPI00192E7B80|nr:defensin-like protein 19 [Eucalyptus grandis]